MRGWLPILGGLSVWAIHLLGIYAIFSGIDLDPARFDASGRWIALGFSLLCLAGAVGLAMFAFRDRRTEPGMRAVGGYGGLVAAVAILFQTAPALLS